MLLLFRCTGNLALLLFGDELLEEFAIFELSYASELAWYRLLLLLLLLSVRDCVDRLSRFWREDISALRLPISRISFFVCSTFLLQLGTVGIELLCAFLVELIVIILACTSIMQIIEVGASAIIFTSDIAARPAPHMLLPLLHITLLEPIPIHAIVVIINTATCYK